jgi:hypothetical protein
VKPQVYHLCDPWRLDWAVIVHIIGMAALTIALCLAGIIRVNVRCV